jgi:hypothetical protein
VTICATPIKAQVARFTRVDECGVPITGALSAQVTTDSFTQIENAPNYEEGQRYLLRKANGEPCVNQRDPGFFNWIEQTVTLCTLDPDLIAMVTGEQQITDSDEAVGTTIGEGLLTARFSIEVWQPMAGEGACDESGLQQYVYWAFPNVGDAQIQAFTFQNDAFTIGFKDITRRTSPLWDLGDAWLADNPTSGWDAGKHSAWAVSTVAPPVAACGAVLVGS